MQVFVRDNDINAALRGAQEKYAARGHLPGHETAQGLRKTSFGAPEPSRTILPLAILFLPPMANAVGDRRKGIPRWRQTRSVRRLGAVNRRLQVTFLLAAK